MILFSDEAHFHLSGHVSRQNMRFWASQQPHKHTQRPLSQEKVTVWCGIGKGRIFGAYIFEDNDGNRVTINAEQYIEMMQRKFVPALRRKRGIDMNTVVFQPLNSSGSTSQGTDSSRAEPITPGHPIPQISTL